MTNSAPSDESAPHKDQTHSEGRWGSIRKWFENNWSQVLFFVGGLALYLLLGLFLFWLLQRYVDPSAIKDPSKEAAAKKDLLQALGLLMAGIAGAIGVYFTWRGQRITREGLEDTLRITREGQITERFTRAIDQLGATNDDNSKNRELRLGGIYALERIARESEEDHWAIMEILTAYVRRHAPSRPEEAQQVRDRPAADIRAIMTVLGRRTRSLGDREPPPLDLHATSLTSAALFRAYLSRADLWRANLSVAHLGEADLSRAYLKEANLSLADLVKANLRGANLKEANLRVAHLRQADLREADLREADLSGADLVGADLTQDQLGKATRDENTRLPSSLKPPAHRGVKPDKQSERD